MKRYLAYLWYVMRHKWFVMLECFKMGLIWQGIIHDMSKFNLEEFIKYANVFYDKDGKMQDIRDKTGAYNASKVLGKAWFHHVKCNKHHWQYWILAEDCSTPPLTIFKIGNDENKYVPSAEQIERIKDVIEKAKNNPPYCIYCTGNLVDEIIPANFTAIEMPLKYIKEMVCDWRGAARAQGKKPNPIEFYDKNKHKMLFHENTKKKLQKLLGGNK